MRKWILFGLLGFYGGSAFGQIGDVQNEKMPKEICWAFDLKLIDPKDVRNTSVRKGPEICVEFANLFQKDDVECSGSFDNRCYGERTGSLNFKSLGYSFQSLGDAAYHIYPHPEGRRGDDERTPTYIFAGWIDLYTNWEYRLSNILASFRENSELGLESIILPGDTNFNFSFEVSWFGDKIEVSPRAFRAFGAPPRKIKVSAVGFDGNNKEYDVFIDPRITRISFQTK
ncbi:MAG: hypothetical protein AB7T49_14225 [Oligoflexales bacterium]